MWTVRTELTDRILILDFGSQVSQLIALRVREQQVYCELHPFDVSDEFVRNFGAHIGRAEVADVARTVNAQGRSMGMELTSCTVPAAGKPTFDLPEDEMEIGVGIHGEPGRHRVPLAPASEIAQQLVDPILADFDAKGPAIVMLNGLGGSPLIELYLMYGEVAKLLEKGGVRGKIVLVA